MNSSISVALSKVRPDLTKDKKFRPLTPERQASMRGDYRDPDAGPAKEGELSPAETAVGSEINRMLATEAQQRLAAQDKFYRKHAASLVALIALASASLVGFAVVGRNDVKARVVAADVDVAPVVAAPVVSAPAAAVAPEKTVHEVAKPEAAVAAAAQDAADEVIVLHSTPALTVRQTAALSPVARGTEPVAQPVTQPAAEPMTIKSSTSSPLIPVNAPKADNAAEGEVVVAAATVAAPVVSAKKTASAVIKDNGAAASSAQVPVTTDLEDGASVANAPSLKTGEGSVPVVAATSSTSNPGEVLYEADSVPSVAAGGGVSTKKTGSKRSKSSDASSEENPNELRVSGIFWDKTRPLALINDKIVEVGTMVHGAKVVSIEPQMVTLSEGGKTRTLKP